MVVELEAVKVVVAVVVLFANRCERLAATFGWSFKNFKKLARRDVMTGCSVPLSSQIRGGGCLSGVCGWSGQLRLPPLDGRGDCASERYLNGISLLLFCHAASELMVVLIVGTRGVLGV